MTRSSGKPSSSKSHQKQAGRPFNWEPKWSEAFDQYTIRPQYEDGKRPIIRLGQCLVAARLRIASEIRPDVLGKPSLDKGATLFEDAIPLILDEHERENRKWSDRDSIESRLRRASLPVHAVALKDIESTRKFWQSICDYARAEKPEGLGLGFETLKKLRVTIGQAIAVLIHEEWVAQYDHTQLRIGSEDDAEPVKRRAHPTADEFVAFCDDQRVPLAVRLDEAFRVELASYRAGDRHVITWALLGAGDVDEGGKSAPFSTFATFPNRKAQNGKHSKKKSVLVWRKIAWKLDDGSWSYARKLAIELWLEAGRPTGKTAVFLDYKGEQQTTRSQDAALRRYWYAQTMGIELDYRRGTCDPTPEDAPEVWTAHRVQLLLGDAELDRMGYHSSRSDFDTRVNRYVTDDAAREGLTQHKHETSKEHYDEGRHDVHTMPAAALKRRKASSSGRSSPQDPQ